MRTARKRDRIYRTRLILSIGRFNRINTISGFRYYLLYCTVLSCILVYTLYRLQNTNTRVCWYVQYKCTVCTVQVCTVTEAQLQ